MKERPVIFNGEMVRAIIDGRKTQTRRPIKFPLLDKNMGCELAGNELAGEVRAGNYSNVPFGQVGDRLWVRETWQGPLVDEEHLDDYLANVEKFQTPQFCEYAADGGARPEFCDLDDNVRQGWRPSIHMPRWASRITLEITAVRVERLNDISDGDAISEGCSISDMKSGDCVADVFARLWSSIYGVDSWNANPWVWVIEFRRVDDSASEVERGQA
ncbi:ASCH domain-containing protein [Serratia marcescens]|uniref:morphogenetic protein n=1 Tax=Serratia marcescens TaxID=615 RepID=UPI000B5F61E5|nr:morphogenetic protein [Serratia marcescens]ASM11823.1 morphogenetic protein [Serratia marcescens]